MGTDHAIANLRTKEYFEVGRFLGWNDFLEFLSKGVSAHEIVKYLDRLCPQCPNRGGLVDFIMLESLSDLLLVCNDVVSQYTSKGYKVYVVDDMDEPVFRWSDPSGIWKNVGSIWDEKVDRK